MGKVQVAVDQVIDVIAVGDRRVPASRPVPVRGVMTAAGMAWRAGGRIDVRDAQDMFINVVLVDVVQMAVVQVIGVVFMRQGWMPAAVSMPMTVVGMNRVSAHKTLLSWLATRRLPVV